jgi:hypothetical protein
MDTLRVDIKFETSVGAAHPELTLEILINEEIIAPGFPIAILELHDSVHKSGIFFIWTCSCGVPACGGIHFGVSVAHTTDSVSWQVPKVPLAHETHFSFDRTDYTTVVMMALKEYLKYIKAYSAANIRFDACHDWELDGLLERMAKKQYPSPRAASTP